MKLDEWLFRKKMTLRKFSDATDISYVVSQYTVSAARKVALANALKVVRFTDGEVTLEDLLDDGVLDLVNKIIPYNQSNE
jgi:DNA-binding transcriptional regulator YdaS (Cro superfamily)